jgi:dTDP-glucose 4,6-dehydratase
MSLLEMAQLMVELTGSQSEIVFEALPVDDPKIRQPEITRAQQLLGWEPEIDVREGLRRTIDSYTERLAAPT